MYFVDRMEILSHGGLPNGMSIENFYEGISHPRNSTLMTVVVLRLGSKGKDGGDNAIRLLSKMFSTDLDYNEKLDALENEFQISTSREISEEVQEVCNLSTGVFNKAYNKGYDLGYDSGISAGELRKARDTAYELYDMGMSSERIARAVKVSIDTVREWLAEREEMLV